MTTIRTEGWKRPEEKRIPPKKYEGPTSKSMFELIREKQEREMQRR